MRPDLGKGPTLPKTKFCEKPRNANFGSKILILNFLWILEEKLLKFRIPCVKSQFSGNPPVGTNNLGKAATQSITVQKVYLHFSQNYL